MGLNSARKWNSALRLFILIAIVIGVIFPLFCPFEIITCGRKNIRLLFWVSFKSFVILLLEFIQTRLVFFHVGKAVELFVAYIGLVSRNNSMILPTGCMKCIIALWAWRIALTASSVFYFANLAGLIKNFKIHVFMTWKLFLSKKTKKKKIFFFNNKV